LPSREKLPPDFIAVPAPAARDAAKEAWQRSPSLLRTLTLILLIAFAVVAWVMLISHSHTSMETMGVRAGHFLKDWAVMMVAMMFPTAAFMILAFNKAEAGKREPEDAFASTWAFVLGYLLIWIAAGIAAYAGVSAAVHIALSPAIAVQCGGAILLLAGLYQLTPLKAICLTECRSPINMTTWHRATIDSFQMGLLHGLYCIGCNWLFFAALFPLGMTVGAMAVIALIVLAEKTLPWPKAVSYTAGVGLVLYGALLIASAQL
jgi:predicted metal-binding membrane protein